MSKDAPTPFLPEFCAENLTFVPAAIAAGARRIELCDNLSVGGTTPSVGVIAAAIARAHPHGVRVMCMARPRGGDFVYDEGELGMIEADITAAISLGADGVVFGCLSPLDAPAHAAARARDLAASRLPGSSYGGDYRLDLPAIERLASLVRRLGDERGRGVDITFHMAFDALPDSDQLMAIDALADRGVSRILTHGGPASSPIEGNLERLRAFMDRASDRLTILPGAGITHANATHIAASLAASELHGTRIVDISVSSA